ncbi:hypothetical protein GY969_23495, partial [Escherichia coli]|nr:hypothetical protein [Escherichia coli]
MRFGASIPSPKWTIRFGLRKKTGCGTRRERKVSTRRAVRSSAWPVIQIFSLNAPLALWVFAHLIFERPIDKRLFALA